MNRFLLMNEETGGDGTALGGEPAAVVAPVVAPATDGNWYDSLPQDMREDQNITKFESVEVLAKSWQHAQKMIGADKIPMPQSEDDWNNVYGKLGRPDEASLYKIEAPEGFEVNQEAQDSFKEFCHKLGLNQNQTQLAATFDMERQMAGATASTEASKAALTEAQNSLKGEWGEAHEQNVNIAARAASEFMGEDGAKFFDEAMIDGVPAGEHPGLLKMFHSVAKGMMESSNLEGLANEGKQTPQEIQDSINTLMQNPAYIDPRHLDHKSVSRKVQALFELQAG